MAAESATFIYEFVGIGLSADSGTPLAMPLQVGVARSVEMALRIGRSPRKRRWIGAWSTRLCRMTG